jgi:hypothetical protein
MFGAELAAPEPRPVETLPTVDELLQRQSQNGGDESHPPEGPNKDDGRTRGV